MAWFVSLGLMAIALARVRASFLSWTAAVAGLLVALGYKWVAHPRLHDSPSRRPLRRVVDQAA